MSYLNEITTFINAGSWGTVTKPFICESPLFSREKITMFRRAIHVEFENEEFEELDFARKHEGDSSRETYILFVVDVSRDTVRAAIQQIRKIVIAYSNDNSSTRTYNSVFLGNGKIFRKVARWQSLFNLYCYKVGKIRE